MSSNQPNLEKYSLHHLLASTKFDSEDVSKFFFPFHKREMTFPSKFNAVSKKWNGECTYQTLNYNANEDQNKM